MFMGALMICGKRPHMGLLNSIVAGIRSPAPTGVGHICNKTSLVSWLLLVHFFIVCFTNLMHAYT